MTTTRLNPRPRRWAVAGLPARLALHPKEKHSTPALTLAILMIAVPYPVFTSERKQVGKKLYVGNLSYDVDKAGLEQMFAAYGTVTSAQVITDRETGRSKGFGFVEMGNDQEAQSAISALNGKSVEGRPLTVNEARPQESRGGGGGGGGGRGPYGGGRSGGGGRGGFGGGGGGGGNRY